MHLRHLAWSPVHGRLGPNLLSERQSKPWASRLLLWLETEPPTTPRQSPDPITYLGSQLLLSLGGKFRAAVDRDVHLGHDLTNPLLHGHTLVCRKESFQHQESILLELQAGRRLRLPPALK